ncbi:hypothetical protein [Streptomyces sp. NBC_01408]|uniref:hypothetical protein n=1 Tax=Streptomyces sp. NBC_01408 TaxID=2903855 RepID=UPI002257AF53|nr:hypothetical protein [Streptomyces sp. NBC_01408]MCX4692397.1 hypothetical protein [Streptomyces sp. NBC_01408]
MRTKPTMYKRMLRSVLAIVFSAVAVFWAVSAVESDAGSARGNQGTELMGKASDTGWTIGPVDKYADTGWTSGPLNGKSDTGWTTAPATVSA